MRVLPKGCRAEIGKGSWRIPEIFTFLQKEGRVRRAEMFRTFNMGVGMIICASPADAEKISARLKRKREEHYLLGKVVPGPRGVSFR